MANCISLSMPVSTVSKSDSELQNGSCLENNFLGFTANNFFHIQHGLYYFIWAYTCNFTVKLRFITMFYVLCSIFIVNESR